ncbi:MAG TPA: mechanosensitive ion channel family protein [Blastocatellia bacterium]|nr:mechanosensitive ion channel family protein [Blastocatellia bacterium]
MNLDIGPAWEKINSLLNGAVAILPNLVLAIVMFAVALLLSRWLKRLIGGAYSERHRNLGILMGRLTQWLVISFALLVTMSIVLPSFHARDLIQILGISGVAIGFAFRDILQNFLAGILLLLAQPFRLGDEIAVGNYEGVVQEIQGRATLIKTYDGYLVVIPNSAVYTQSVKIFNAYPVRRTAIDVGIGFGDDVDEARRLMLEAISGVDGVLTEPPPSVVTKAFGDSGVILRARWWTKSPRREMVRVRDYVIPAIRRKLGENGIDLPYPTQQVLFHDQTEETDGDRARQREGWPAGRGTVPRPRSIAQSISRVAEIIPQPNGDAGGKERNAPSPEGRQM